jgi:hypothetical protein
MRESKMNVRLVASPWMDAREETERDRIRIPKRARLSFDVAKTRITIKTPSMEKGLEVKQARLEDVHILMQQLKAGKISAEQADMTVFVCSNTRDRFMGKARSKKNLWITDRLDILKIGADPEFCLVDPATGRFKYAAQVVGLTKTGELGQDGPLAELRPKPATSPKELVETMKKILEQNKDKIDKYEWLGGATFKNAAYPGDRTLSIGGHIHIGNPSVLPEGKKTSIHQRIIQILDETIAIPLCRIDTPDPGARRNAGGGGAYGRWGDTRPQEGRFEWRVPSGFWSAHPDIAVAVLGVTKAVSEECYQRMSDKDFDSDYISAQSNRAGFLKDWDAIAQEKAAKLVNDSNPDSITNDILVKMEERLKSMSNYKDYQDEIDAFVDLVNISPDDRSKISLDLKKNWLDGHGFLNK